MKKTFLLCFLFSISVSLMARDKDSTIYYNLPDSVKAVQFFAELQVESIAGKKEIRAGIRTDAVQLYLEADKNDREIVFEYDKRAALLVAGLNVSTKEKGELTFAYNWSTGKSYKLLIGVATDSAGNFSLYSGYVFLPEENKWKIIGTCKITGQWTWIKQPAGFYSAGKNQNIVSHFHQALIQRTSGSWKNLDPGKSLPNPTINLFGHLDSVQQRTIDNAIIAKSAQSTGSFIEGIYYEIIRQGTGRQVVVTDTVSAYYRVNLLHDTATIDQAKDKPASFPLNRLIRGWQIGVPLLKVGGKIKLLIPSDLAYSIRTRSAKIPPNSILEFIIEVVEAIPAKQDH